MKAFLTRAIHSRPAHWATCLIISTAHLGLLYSLEFPAATSFWLVPLLLSLPGLLTFILVPKSIRKWYRWVVLVFLSMTVQPPSLMPLVMGVGIAWALYMSWFAERPLPIKQMFTLRKDPTAKKPTTVSELLAAEKAAELKTVKTDKPGASKSVRKLQPKPATKKVRAAAAQAAKSATIKAAATPTP